MSQRYRHLLGACLIATTGMISTTSACAQEADNTTAAPDGHRQRSTGHDQDIVVAGYPPIDFGLLTSTASIQGDALIAQMKGQIGDTLARLPGVSATSFTPGASRPVLRGLDGDRIRVLTDGIGAIDASSVSADHAVVFDALNVDHIDIIHGPALMIFGGQAIGGAVNAIDKRIPRSVPEHITMTAMGGYGSAADERSAATAMDLPLDGSLVLHLDASWRKSNDQRAGGFVNSAALRGQLLEEAALHRLAGETDEADEFAELAKQSGRLPNSAARSQTLGAGIAHIGNGGNIGLSVQHYDTKYGVPLRPGGGHGHEEGEEEHETDSVAIDLRQTRVDLRGEVKLGSAFDSLQIRAAYGKYVHVELEGGAVGTRFAGDGIEARADLLQSDRGGWRGRSGFQIESRKLTIRGAEAFTPDNAVDRFGVFTLQALKIGMVEIEAAGRYEHVKVSSQPAGFSRGFSLWSGAFGVSHEPIDGLRIGANYIRGARAPAPDELLSNGLHVATQAFETGNPEFRVETSNGFEGYLRYNGNRVSLELTGYLTSFRNFIATIPTGGIENGFPVFRYVQLPARYAGFEATVKVEAIRWEGGSLTLDGSADYTRSRLKGVGPTPRIPPMRLRGGVEMRHGTLRLRAEVEWNDAQNRVAAFENRVTGFTLFNLSADWHPLGEDSPLTLLLSADNLFDATGRRAASITRDFVPIAGRDIRLTAKLAF